MENKLDQLKTICQEKAINLYGNPLPDVVQERLDREFYHIEKNDFTGHYLQAIEETVAANKKGYIVTSYLTAGASLVAFFSGFTHINPLPAH